MKNFQKLNLTSTPDATVDFFLTHYPYESHSASELFISCINTNELMSIIVHVTPAVIEKKLSGVGTSKAAITRTSLGVTSRPGI